MFDTMLENPCVGASIPPRATRNKANATFGWRFCLCIPKRLAADDTLAALASDQLVFS